MPIMRPAPASSTGHRLGALIWLMFIYGYSFLFLSYFTILKIVVGTHRHKLNRSDKTANSTMIQTKYFNKIKI